VGGLHRNWDVRAGALRWGVFDLVAIRTGRRDRRVTACDRPAGEHRCAVDRLSKFGSE